jgi:hypothetical protein
MVEKPFLTLFLCHFDLNPAASYKLLLKKICFERRLKLSHVLMRRMFLLLVFYTLIAIWMCQRTIFSFANSSILHPHYMIIRY